MCGVGGCSEGSRRAVEKALLGENDRAVAETPLHSKHLKDWTGFITGQHESCSTHTGNWPLHRSLYPTLSPSTAFCLNWKMARREGWMERGRAGGEGWSTRSFGVASGRHSLLTIRRRKKKERKGNERRELTVEAVEGRWRK